MSTCGRTYISPADIPYGSPRGSGDTPSDSTLPPQTVFLSYQAGTTATSPPQPYPQDNFGWSGGDDYGNYCNCDEQSITKMTNPTSRDSGGSYGGTPDTSGAKWQGCGKCQPSSEDAHWDCCGCCISSWNPINKENCCNPIPSVPSNQNPSWYCDPNWCPWSDSCLSTESTKNYCLSHPTDTNCLSVCMNFATSNTVGNAPSWCQAFMSNYCSTKSANDPSMNNASTADKTICACSLHMTPSDECLWPQCKLSPDGQTWRTPQQYSNANDPDYCTKQCKNISGAVENKTGGLSASQYNQVCGNVPLPGVGGSGGSGNDKSSGQSWSDWFKSLPDWFSSLPVYYYVIIGVILFIGLVLLGRYVFSMYKSKMDNPVKTTDVSQNKVS
jgi:hypothetical protein